jgi:hypothetical protein
MSFELLKVSINIPNLVWNNVIVILKQSILIMDDQAQENLFSNIVGAMSGIDGS